MIDFTHLYFAAPDLDLADVLTSVGMTVKIGDTVIGWAHTLGDLGSEPEGLDCTPLSSKVKLEKAGILDQEKWVVDYYFTKEGYKAVEALKGATSSSPIVVEFADGTKFTNTGKVSANYLSGQSVNGIAQAHAVIELSSTEGWTLVEG